MSVIAVAVSGLAVSALLTPAGVAAPAGVTMSPGKEPAAMTVGADPEAVSFRHLFSRLMQAFGWRPAWPEAVAIA